MKLIYLLPFLIYGCTSDSCYDSEILNEIISRDFAKKTFSETFLPIRLNVNDEYDEFLDSINENKPPSTAEPPPKPYNEGIFLNRLDVAYWVRANIINKEEYELLLELKDELNPRQTTLCPQDWTIKETYSNVVMEGHLENFHEICLPIILDNLLILIVNHYHSLTSDLLSGGKGICYFYRKKGNKWIQVDRVMLWIS